MQGEQAVCVGIYRVDNVPRRALLLRHGLQRQLRQRYHVHPHYHAAHHGFRLCRHHSIEYSVVFIDTVTFVLSCLVERRREGGMS